MPTLELHAPAAAQTTTASNKFKKTLVSSVFTPTDTSVNTEYYQKGELDTLTLEKRNLSTVSSIGNLTEHTNTESYASTTWLPPESEPSAALDNKEEYDEMLQSFTLQQTQQFEELPNTVQKEAVYENYIRWKKQTEDISSFEGQIKHFFTWFSDINAQQKKYKTLFSCLSKYLPHGANKVTNIEQEWIVSLYAQIKKCEDYTVILRNSYDEHRSKTEKGRVFDTPDPVIHVANSRESLRDAVSNMLFSIEKEKDKVNDQLRQDRKTLEEGLNKLVKKIKKRYSNLTDIFESLKKNDFIQYFHSAEKRFTSLHNERVTLKDLEGKLEIVGLSKLKDFNIKLKNCVEKIDKDIRNAMCDESVKKGIRAVINPYLQTKTKSRRRKHSSNKDSTESISTVSIHSYEKESRSVSRQSRYSNSPSARSIKSKTAATTTEQQEFDAGGDTLSQRLGSGGSVAYNSTFASSQQSMTTEQQEFDLGGDTLSQRLGSGGSVAYNSTFASSQQSMTTEQQEFDVGGDTLSQRLGSGGSVAYNSTFAPSQQSIATEQQEFDVGGDTLSQRLGPESSVAHSSTFFSNSHPSKRRQKRSSMTSNSSQNSQGVPIIETDSMGKYSSSKKEHRRSKTTISDQESEETRSAATVTLNTPSSHRRKIMPRSQNNYLSSRSSFSHSTVTKKPRPTTSSSTAISFGLTLLTTTNAQSQQSTAQDQNTSSRRRVVTAYKGVLSCNQKNTTLNTIPAFLSLVRSDELHRKELHAIQKGKDDFDTTVIGEGKVGSWFSPRPTN